MDTGGGGTNKNNDEEEEVALRGGNWNSERFLLTLGRDACRCGCRGGTAAAAARSDAVSSVCEENDRDADCECCDWPIEDRDADSERCDCECCFQDCAASLTEMTGEESWEGLREDRCRPWELLDMVCYVTLCCVMLCYG